MKADRDLTVRRHRAFARGVGASYAVAGGLIVVGVLAASLTIGGLLGVHPLTSRASAGGVWLRPGLASARLAPGTSPSSSASPPSSGLPPAAPADSFVGPPTNLRIPKISVNTPLESLGLDDTGVLQPPSFADAGWYSGGTVPGDVGPAVIAGHIDSIAGPSVFFKLTKLKAGDLVQVERGGRWINFTVVAVGQYPKSNFPTADVYGPTPTPQLRLITCGGSFNRGKKSYVDNVVVYAVINS